MVKPKQPPMPDRRATIDTMNKVLDGLFGKRNVPSYALGTLDEIKDTRQKPYRDDLAMMAEAGIPFECQYWNINRLLVLLNVIEARRNPKKMSQAEIYKQNADLNAQRKAQLNTRG